MTKNVKIRGKKLSKQILRITRRALELRGIMLQWGSDAGGLVAGVSGSDVVVDIAQLLCFGIPAGYKVKAWGTRTANTMSIFREAVSGIKRIHLCFFVYDSPSSSSYKLPSIASKGFVSCTMKWANTLNTPSS